MRTMEINSRVKNPFVVTVQAVVVGSMLVAAGCRSVNQGSSDAVNQPSPVVMPPSASSSTPVMVMPAPQPDLKPAPAPAPLTLEQAGGIAYTVKNGDSLSSIAYRHGVSAREIAELNGITNPNKIHAGQKLVLPAYAKERHIAE